MNPELCGWASRHTAESWKERYKKRRTIYDQKIREIVEQNPPSSQYQLWPNDRRLNGQGIRISDIEEEEEEGETETQNEEEEEEIGQQNEEEEEERGHRYDEPEGDEGRNASGTRHTVMNHRTRQSRQIQKSVQPATNDTLPQPRSENQRDYRHQVLRGKGKEKAVQQEHVEEYDYEK